MSQDDIPEDWEDIDTSDAVVQSNSAPPAPLFAAFAPTLQEPLGDVSTQQYALKYQNKVQAPPAVRTEVQPVQKVRKPREKQEVKEPEVDKDSLIAKQVSQAKASGESLVAPDSSRVPLNIVFIGHVDAGKSTICGNLLLSLGKVDQRSVEHYEAEAKEKGRDSWWLAYIMDQNEEERTKGITIEVGRANFETPHKRFTVLDAPGHRDFVPNMIAGAAQADYGVLVVSAREGEFEAGFNRGGQTQEHALLARSCGITKILVLVNKMDDSTVQWNESRFTQIRTCIEPFLRDVCRFDVQNSVQWVALSGLTGDNLCRPMNCSWNCGPPLIEVLDSLTFTRSTTVSSLRIPILDRFRDQGLWLLGKVEAGRVVKGQEVVAAPAGIRCEVLDLLPSAAGEDTPTRLVFADSGENLKLRVKVSEDIDLLKGFVLCDPWNICSVTTAFQAQVRILELLEHKPLITAGYQCVLHIHTAVLDCSIAVVHWRVDSISHKKVRAVYGKGGSRLVVTIQTSEEVCVETFATHPLMGRFTLRDEGRTIGFGKVIKVLATDATDDAL